MIPKAFITEWKKYAPWKSDYQVEQDLIIERALVEIFSDDSLREQLAFRGGTALHKLFLKPQARYSEDIDLVQINSGSIGDTLTKLRERLEFLGTANYRASQHNAILIYSFDSEFEPVSRLKLKIEINTRDHFSVFGFQNIDFKIASEWFSGDCKIISYSIEELLSTKLRAMYQRRKGRDLFDIWYAYKNSTIDSNKVLKGFKKYLENDGTTITQHNYLDNMNQKIEDDEFLGDTAALLRTDISYDHSAAWDLVKKEIITKL